MMRGGDAAESEQLCARFAQIVVRRECEAQAGGRAVGGSHGFFAVAAEGGERLVLVARGVDEKSLIVPEAGHLALRGPYESNLRGYAEGGAAGVHAWTLYAAEAFAAAAEASPLRRAAEG